jgi:CRISPR/Cas system CSM-associated protein Csm3 (group 7 of RAMP superfamily)
MSKSKMDGPPNSPKDISCLRVIGRFPPTYIDQSNISPNSLPPPLIQLKSKMPKQDQTSKHKLEVITISESQVSSEQQPILETQTQNQIPCFSSQLIIQEKVRLRRILPKTSTRKETIQSDTKPSKKKYNPRKAHRTHICHICRDITDKHKYYGGQACKSCTVFFKQAVQTHCNLTYFCIRDKTCKISLKTRKFCNYCRYQACLAAGMRTDWVLSKGNRDKFLSTVHNNKQNQKSDSDSDVCEIIAEPKSLTPRILITEDELLEITEYVKMSEFFEASKVKDIEISLIRELIR